MNTMGLFIPSIIEKEVNNFYKLCKENDIKIESWDISRVPDTYDFYVRFDTDEQKQTMDKWRRELDSEFKKIYLKNDRN